MTLSLARHVFACMAVLLLAMAASGVPVPQGAAAQPEPTLAVTPSSGPCDRIVEVRGGGFQPGEEVPIDLARPSSDDVMGRLTSVTADSDGGFSAAISLGLLGCKAAALQDRFGGPPGEIRIYAGFRQDVMFVAAHASYAYTTTTLSQTVRRVGYRNPPPSCAEGIEQLGLEGQPVWCEEPPPPTYDPPKMHGDYRLYPGSYVGPLTFEVRLDTAPRGVVSDDLEAIKSSSMYVEPGWLPDGYTLSSINTNGYDSEHVIAATYTGPGQPIHINHIRRFEWPVDIAMPQEESSAAIFETLVLAGTPAVLYYPKPAFVSGQTVLQFAQDEVETIVYGDSLDPTTAIEIALSLVCGTPCTSAAGVVRSQIRLESAVPTVAQQAAAVSSDPANSASTSLSWSALTGALIGLSAFLVLGALYGMKARG